MVTNKAQETFAQHHRPGFIVFIVPWRCWWVHWGEGWALSFHSNAVQAAKHYSISMKNFDLDDTTFLHDYMSLCKHHCCTTLYVYIYLFWFCISVHICWNIFWICLKVLHLIHTHTHEHIALWLHFIWFDSFFIRKWLKCPNKQIQFPNNEKKEEKTTFISYCHYM